MFILFFLSHWRLYKKIGKPGWVCLIPFYNIFALCEAVLGSGMWMFFPFLSALLVIILTISAKSFSLILLLPMIIVVFRIVFIVKYIHDFGKSGWWTIGGIFGLTPFFTVVFGLTNIKFKDGSLEYKEYDFVDGLFDFLENQKYKNRINRVAYDGNQEIILCPKCGTQLRKNAKYCHVCGEAINKS